MLWLRPVNTPDDFKRVTLHGYGGGEAGVESNLLVHWGGGIEMGACVKMDEVHPIKDKNFKFWTVKPVALEPDESKRVYLNVTHQIGEVRPYSLSLITLTLDDEGKEKRLNGRLDLTLVPPNSADGPVTDPVRGIWRQDGSLQFLGSQLLDYVPRWHPSDSFVVQAAGDLPSRLAFKSDGRHITAKLDGRPLLDVEDLDFDKVDGKKRDLTSISPCLPELYHFCDGRYYVLRVWFLWVNRLIGEDHEVPDAERIDVLFDLLNKKVRFLATDFHYKELWGEPFNPDRGAQAKLGLKWHTLDEFNKTYRAVGKKEVYEANNPSAMILTDLCGTGPTSKTFRGSGTAAHVPLLENVLFQFKSKDVREL
jgi:hypothetical protein